MKTNETFLGAVKAMADDHECPYAEQLLREDERQRIGASGIRSAILASLVSELEGLHAGGDCPPTHVGAGPTTEWANWVKDVQR